MQTQTRWGLTVGGLLAVVVLASSAQAQGGTPEVCMTPSLLGASGQQIVCTLSNAYAYEGSGHFRAKIYSKPEASVMRQHTAKKRSAFHTELHALWSIKTFKIDMSRVPRQ